MRKNYWGDFILKDYSKLERDQGNPKNFEFCVIKNFLEWSLGKDSSGISKLTIIKTD